MTISIVLFEEILKSNFTLPHDKNLLVGNSSKDDAAVYDIGNGSLSYSYSYKYLPIAKERLLQAGIRLAALLNTIYG